MLTTSHLQRVFVMEDKGQKIKLSDPQVTFSPQAVLNFYSATYPILTTATVSGPVIADDTVQYTFTSVIGTKG
ncbi:PRTRC system protein C [Dyadobacter frigoris]|uniref:PRTRC system protein C n=1 Tax=Dyadobacter frigoris TaxID=2576211 RepID=A0A4U6CMX8_9BACT|nr:PRTRC system protein C [Dyadobacter frigoris]TKT84895.1 PRTRC system protein C [Dyadobacter frigoris]